ncbi:hypothetical protein [Aquimarina algicola]|uniref:Uncharacterized protein n=1 Tax=Aquimarina algicola TaxID=2589995 RepID=A0A504JDK5_9FLAO|nr:hypothetical protein [Aquimarina algicola]TPN85798.1 hypothetical protein FHK87_10945 [Aquimarina algicola]
MDVLANITEQEFTEAGEIPIGFLYASIKNVGTVSAAVNGVALAAGEAKSYPFVGKPYGAAIPYDPKDATLRILYIL